MKIKSIKEVLSTIVVLIIFTLWSVIFNTANAQAFTPAHWTFGAEVSDGTQATLSFTARLDDKWHIFSPNHKGEVGLPTVFTIEKGNGYELDGDIIEPKPLEELDEITKTTLKYFAKEVSFKQKIKIKSDKSFIVKGVLTYQACNDEGCIAPIDVDFNIEINMSSK